MTTGAWRWCLGTPALIAAFNSLLWLVYFRQDSVDFCIEKGREEEAKALLKRVYRFSYPGEVTETLNSMKEAREQAKGEHIEVPGLWQVLSSYRYRSCTYFLMVAAVLNQLSGINAIGLYSNTILGEIDGINPVTGNYYLFAA